MTAEGEEKSNCTAGSWTEICLNSNLSREKLASASSTRYRHCCHHHHHHHHHHHPPPPPPPPPPRRRRRRRRRLHGHHPHRRRRRLHRHHPHRHHPHRHHHRQHVGSIGHSVHKCQHRNGIEKKEKAWLGRSFL